MLISCTNNCTGMFASKFSVLSVIFHVSKLKKNSLACLNFISVREFYEFLKFINFSVYVPISGFLDRYCLANFSALMESCSNFISQLICRCMLHDN